MGTKKENNSNGSTSKNGNFELAEAPALRAASRSGRKNKTSAKETLKDSSYQPAIFEQLSGHLDNKNMLNILIAVKNGDFSVRMPNDQVGLSGKICDTLNE